MLGGAGPPHGPASESMPTRVPWRSYSSWAGLLLLPLITELEKLSSRTLQA